MMDVECGRKVNRRGWGTFVSPGCHFSGMDVEDPAPAQGKRDRYSFRSMHCTTPISADRCHYWWSIAQDYGHHIPKDELISMIHGFVATVFKQDKDLLEAIQVTVDQGAATSPEVLLASDRAAIEARRIVQRMLDAEAAT